MSVRLASGFAAVSSLGISLRPDRFEIHTNFTGTAKKVYAFNLSGLAKPENLDTLRKLFTDPQTLRPGQTSIGITPRRTPWWGL